MSQVVGTEEIQRGTTNELPTARRFKGIRPVWEPRNPYGASRDDKTRCIPPWCCNFWGASRLHKESRSKANHIDEVIPTGVDGNHFFRRHLMVLGYIFSQDEAHIHHHVADRNADLFFFAPMLRKSADPSKRLPHKPWLHGNPWKAAVFGKMTCAR